MRGPFKEVVASATAGRLDVATLLKSDDRIIFVWMLNSALRSALIRRGVRHDRYYFLPETEGVTRRVEAKTKTGRNQSAKKVVRQEGERTGTPKDIWWHLAAQLRFEQFGPNFWGLTIRPEFHLGPVTVRTMDLLVGRKKLTSASSGGRPATAAMLDFCVEHGVTAEVEVLPSAQVNEALDRLRRNDVRYRFVLDLTDLSRSAT